MAEGCPVIAPFVFVEGRIQEAQLLCCLRHLGNNDDQIDVVTAVMSQQSASRYRGQSLGYGLSDSADVIRDHGI
jgi:hypothetical protein